MAGRDALGCVGWAGGWLYDLGLLLASAQLWAWCGLSISTFENGLWGLGWLRPQALFGIEGVDPTVHAVAWSLTLNLAVFVAVSLVTFPGPLERLQGAQFVNVFDHSTQTRGWDAGRATSEDLMVMAQRILGAGEAQTLFRTEARAQGLSGTLPEPTPVSYTHLTLPTTPYV